MEEIVLLMVYFIIRGGIDDSKVNKYIQEHRGSRLSHIIISHGMS